MKTNYASDLTDEQWQLIRGLLPKTAKTIVQPFFCKSDLGSGSGYVVALGR